MVRGTALLLVIFHVIPATAQADWFPHFLSRQPVDRLAAAHSCESSLARDLVRGQSEDMSGWSSVPVFSAAEFPESLSGCCTDDNPDCESWCPTDLRFSEFNIYPTFSYLGNLSATYVEYEPVIKFGMGPFEIENRTVFNTADLPGTITLGSTNPSADPSKVGVRAQGFGDILTGTFVSLKNAGHPFHLGLGPVITFPSATNDILGSGKNTAGPGAHFSTEIAKLHAGFFVWQSWSFTGDDSRDRVNQLFGKPFVIYEMTDEWHAVFIPLGWSLNWDKPSGQNITLPLGGGIRKLYKCGDHTLGLQAQAFKYVERKKSDPEWELRFTIEFLFDE